MTLNQLYFGNPHRKNLNYLNTNNYLDTLLTELQNFPYPENDSDKSLAELNDLVALVERISQNQEIVNRFIAYDSEMEYGIAYALSKAGEDKEKVLELIKQVKQDINPLLVKIKFYYQRIRPYQLAMYRNVPLYPFRSVAADSPSYPSGHAFQSCVYLQVLGNKYPTHYKLIQELCNDIVWSRMYLGQHFASDCDFSVYMADAVCNHPEFKRKYGL